MGIERDLDRGVCTMKLRTTTFTNGKSGIPLHDPQFAPRHEDSLAPNACANETAPVPLAEKRPAARCGSCYTPHLPSCPRPNCSDLCMRGTRDMRRLFPRCVFLPTAWILAVLTLIGSSGATSEQVLHQFVPWAQGANPQSGLVADAAGNFYGTTYNGGRFGWGTVFELGRGSNGVWKESVIHTFAFFNDGGYPSGGLVIDKKGNLYGETVSTVFELSPTENGEWTETILCRFQESGGTPLPLTFDSVGNLYGTTSSGPNNTSILFRLSPSTGGLWIETVLYTFTGNGGSPPHWLWTQRVTCTVPFRQRRAMEGTSTNSAQLPIVGSTHWCMSSQILVSEDLDRTLWR